MGTIQQWFHRSVAKLKQATLNRGQVNQVTNGSKGAQAEAFAVKYLRQQGLILMAQNYHSQFGEIDLIMRDKDTYVFVEVKFRSRDEWADAVESVTWAKQQKIIKTAKKYLQQHRLYDQVACRFDVLAIDKSLKTDKVTWLESAFY